MHTHRNNIASGKIIGLACMCAIFLGTHNNMYIILFMSQYPYTVYNKQIVYMCVRREEKG